MILKEITAKIQLSPNMDDIGKHIKTDLNSVELPSGQLINIKRRMHLGNGVWRIWNDNILLEIKEVGDRISGFEVNNKKIVHKTIKRGGK